jgi:hypothetical protein
MAMPRKRKDEPLQTRVARTINHAYNMNRLSTHSGKAQAASKDVLACLTQRLNDVTDMEARAMYINVPSEGKRKVAGTMTHESVMVNLDIDKDGNVLGVEVIF